MEEGAERLEQPETNMFAERKCLLNITMNLTYFLNKTCMRTTLVNLPTRTE